MTEIPFPRRPRPTDPKFLTAQQLADRWGFHVETIYRLSARRLPYIRLCGQRRYDLADVEAFEAGEKVTA